MALDRLTQITSSGISSTSTITVSAIAGIITATSATVGSGITLSGTQINVGSATTIHNSGIDLGRGTLTSHNINSTGVITATSFSGDGSALTGIAATANVRTNSLVVSGMTTATGGIQVGTTTSIIVGSSFIKNNAVGIGTTTTTGRNPGVGTAVGTLIYNATTQQVEVYAGSSGWIGGLQVPFSATGGSLDTSSRSGYYVHTFTSPGTLTVTGGPAKSTEYLIIAGGAGGGGGGGGGTGGYRSGTITLSSGTYPIQVGGGGASSSDGTPSFLTDLVREYLQ